MSNTLDLANALTVATGYTNYRNNQTNAAYKTSFAAGMVAGGAGLITSANVNSIINTMNSVTGLNVNASNIANSVNTVTSIVTLLQALGEEAVIQQVEMLGTPVAHIVVHLG